MITNIYYIFMACYYWCLLWYLYQYDYVSYTITTTIDGEETGDDNNYVNSCGDENIQLFLNKFTYLSKNKELQTETENLEDLQSLLRFLKKIINELLFSSSSIKIKRFDKRFY